MRQNLNTEEFRIINVRMLASFFKINSNTVLFSVTAGFNQGKNPMVIDKGKAHTKEEAMRWIRKTIDEKYVRQYIQKNNEMIYR